MNTEDERTESFTMRMPVSMKEQIAQMARHDQRSLSDQARYLLSLGMEVREQHRRMLAEAVSVVANASASR